MDFPHKEGQKCPAVGKRNVTSVINKAILLGSVEGQATQAVPPNVYIKFLNETLRPSSHQGIQAVTLIVAQKRPSHFDRHNKVSTRILLFGLMGFL